jgi:hypothetical protein
MGTMLKENRGGFVDSVGAPIDGVTKKADFSKRRRRSGSGLLKATR